MRRIKFRIDTVVGSVRDKQTATQRAASTMGRKDGKSRSDAKAAAARENGRRGGRPMKYQVNVYDEGSYITGYNDISGRDVPGAVNDLASQHPRSRIYVEWSRKSDGQHGYLNPDGDHDITGRPWYKGDDD